LRGHAHGFQEFAKRHVEGFFIHRAFSFKKLISASSYGARGADTNPLAQAPKHAFLFGCLAT
jgi:hypothetical protein